MPILETSSADVVSGATSIPLSQFFSVTAATSNPAYLVVCAIDRNEYTVASNGDLGSFAGDGNTLDFSGGVGDGSGCGIVYTWQKSSGQYVNATYGSLTSLTYNASDSPNDVTNISVFGTSNAALAQQDAGNAYNLMQADAAGYVGSVTVATQPDFSGTATGASPTPDAVATAAQSFVGAAWNMDGCWVLASTIAAEAGASLPVQSTAIGVAGKANGPWIVVYNGPTSAKSGWQSLVSTGDIISFVPAGGGGHITTCVSGSGSSAMLIDNITYGGPGGSIGNSAHDGSAKDIIIAPAHAASQEFTGVNPSSVIIYALDTPVITDKASTFNLSPGKSESLSSLFSAADPGSRSITSYQAYDSLSGDSITLNGHTENSGATITASSLSALGLLSAAGNAGDSDTIDVRAYNGAYWGDWQTLAVTLNPMPPVLSAQTAKQSWTQGSKVSLTLPATLFTDPQGGTLSYAATGVNGASLPSWLNVGSNGRSFTGTVPAGLENFSIVETATDPAGLSASETIAVIVPAAAPALAHQIAAQTWAAGGSVALTLPSDSFTDPQGEALTYKATLSNGGALPSWLKFSASGLSFMGTAPAAAQSLQIKVTATDTSSLSTSETIAVTIAKAAAGLVLAGDWSGGGAVPMAAAVVPETHAGGWLSGLGPTSAGLIILEHHR